MTAVPIDEITASAQAKFQEFMKTLTPEEEGIIMAILKQAEVAADNEAEVEPFALSTYCCFCAQSATLPGCAANVRFIKGYVNEMMPPNTHGVTWFRREEV